MKVIHEIIATTWPSGVRIVLLIIHPSKIYNNRMDGTVILYVEMLKGMGK